MSRAAFSVITAARLAQTSVLLRNSPASTASGQRRITSQLATAPQSATMAAMPAAWMAAETSCAITEASPMPRSTPSSISAASEPRAARRRTACPARAGTARRARPASSGRPDVSTTFSSSVSEAGGAGDAESPSQLGHHERHGEGGQDHVAGHAPLPQAERACRDDGADADRRRGGQRRPGQVAREGPGPRARPGYKPPQ